MKQSHTLPLGVLTGLFFAITSATSVNAAIDPRNDPSNRIVTSATGGVFIDNGTVQLGVNDEGHLNVPGGPPSLGGVTDVGLRYLPTGAEATAPGCLCEGWGVGDVISGVSGSANEAIGIFNITPIEFTSTASTAVSEVQVGETFSVVHDYHPSPATPSLYEVTVSVTNISAADTHLRYRRVMDWDVEPTAFDEYTTIQGSVSAEAVIFASDNGFASADPFAGESSILFTGDAVDSGPADHGALFDFDFGMLAAGETFTFNTYYGAAGTEVDALAALSAIGAEAYSLGQPSGEGGPDIGIPNTFIFAFADIGGPAILPPGSATLISPFGDSTNATPSYTWNAVTGSDQYLLWVQDDDTREYFSRWYTSTEAGCADDDICEINPAAVALHAGAALYGDASYTWWVRTWNTAGHGPWSDPLNYRVIVSDAPGAITLIAPKGATGVSMPAYEWVPADGATWYKVQVWETGAPDNTIDQWYRDIDATCTAAACSVTPAVALLPSNYRWRVRGWNNAGLGPWSNITTFDVGE